MTAGSLLVPERLRPVVLLARMRGLLPADRIADVLGMFAPPIDPGSAGWAALCGALDAYDQAVQAGADTTPARQQVLSAAAAVLRPSPPPAGATHPTRRQDIPDPQWSGHDVCDQAEPRWAGVTGPGPVGGGATDRPGSFLDRLELILAARVGMEMPDTDRDIIDEVVGRVLGLLAGSAALNRSHPLADATVWLLAHVLEDPALHRKVTGIRLELPGLTRATEDFDREVAAMHWLRGETGPDVDRR